MPMELLTAAGFKVHSNFTDTKTEKWILDLMKHSICFVVLDLQ